MSESGSRGPRLRRPVRCTLTLQVTDREREQIERLRVLRHKATRTSAIRLAISQALFLAEAEEQGRRFALTNDAGGTDLVRFVM